MSLLLAVSLFILVLTIIIHIGISFRSKSTLERVLSLDLLAIAGIGAFIILYMIESEMFFLETAKLLALVGFVTALVFSTFLPRAKERFDDDTR